MVTMSHHDGYQLEQNRFLQSSHFCCATSTMAAITVKCVGDRGKNPATTNGGWERSQQAPHSRAARMQHQPLPCNFLFFRFSTCQFRQRSEELLPAPPAERTARAQPTAATRGVAQLRVTREPPAPTSPLPAVPLHARPALSRAGSERTNAATKRGAAEKVGAARGGRVRTARPALGPDASAKLLEASDSPRGSLLAVEKRGGAPGPP